MVELTSLNSLKNVENNLDSFNAPAWIWDADRNRIIAANGHAVKFWQELSVLDLIDTLFGEYHPISLQFAKAIGQITADDAHVDMNIDFSSADIDDNLNCQFAKLNTENDRNVILIHINLVVAQPADDELTNPGILQNDQLVAKMLDNAPAALALFNQSGQFCYANEVCQKIFSRDAEKFTAPTELSDWLLANDKNGDDAKTMADNLIEKCLNYKIANISAKINTAFGARTHSIIAKSFAIKPFQDGEPYILIYLRDVADERHYEQILIERIAKLEQLTQLGSDFYFILDDDLNFVQLGGNFEKLTGYPASDLLGENWHQIASHFNLDPDGVAGEYFADQKSFDNLNIQWPVKDSESSLSLTWRGRSIFENQNGENTFIGNFVTAFENILSVSEQDFAHIGHVDSVSEHIELIDDIDDDDFADEADMANLAALDGIDSESLESDVDEINETDEVEQTSDLKLSTLETNLSEVEAVNFVNLGEALNDNLNQKPNPSNDEQVNDEAEIDSQPTTDDADDIDDVIARSDDVVAEINQILGETAADEHSTSSENAEPPTNELAANIVPAFGASPQDISKFGVAEFDMFKEILDQTPVMAAITSLPSDEGIFTLFANKQMLLGLRLIDDKNDELASEEYTNILSIESMEFLNNHKQEFGDTPLDQEISFLVNGEKHYFDAKINKINWHENKALQFILSPKPAHLNHLDSIDNGDADEAESSVVVALRNSSENMVFSHQLPENEDDDTDNVIQFILDGQAFINQDRVVVSSNIYLNELLGMTNEDIVGMPIGNIIAENDFGVFQDYMNSVLQIEERNLSQQGIELELIDNSGENHAVYMHIQRLDAEQAKGFPSQILVNMRDISEWKKKEAHLRDAKDRAEQENIQKSGFLARISHELRTPLNAIIGFSEVMSDEKFGPLENSRYKGYAQDINESGEHLLSLINDLLDLSKIEAGKVELNFKALDLEPLMLQAVALMQPMADKKRIIIRTSISSTLPQIIADMRSIRQIILNLLSNSIKYSDSGSQVILSALLDDDGEVIVRVRDTGIGMSSDQLETAMEPFKTLNMSTLVDRQGTGLGLPLTKALAEANRAEFSIESATGAGTLVQITFPTTRVLNA